MRRELRTLIPLLLGLGGLLALPVLATSGPGRIDLPLLDDLGQPAGNAAIYNDNDHLIVDVWTVEELSLVSLEIHTGWAEDPVPTDADGRPDPSRFAWRFGENAPAVFEDGFETGNTGAWGTLPGVFQGRRLVLAFDTDLGGFAWGQSREEERVRHIAVHGRVRAPADATNLDEVDVWAWGEQGFDPWPGRWTAYEMAHKARGHFIDSPVEGLLVTTPTVSARTDVAGGFDYFPGETIEVHLGSQLLGSSPALQKVSPVDLFDGADLTDARVVNMATLLQSLDADADPQPGITITPAVEACFEEALQEQFRPLDWADDAMIDSLIARTISTCQEVVVLQRVDRDLALANLERALNSNMNRKNVSRTPLSESAKAKINVLPMWLPALRADGDLATYLDSDGTTHVGIPYYDDDGVLLRVADEAKPLIVTYTDSHPETGGFDVFGSISRDDGRTWKSMNLSRTADLSSFDLENGQPYYGETRKPVFQVKQNRILVAWTSKFCRGGRPTYAISTSDDLPQDDPFWTDDIWGVGGPQLSRDYTEDGFPEVGEVPFSCIWTARGVVVTEDLISSSPAVWGEHAAGDIVWFKPERLTSGRRDAYQVFVAAADGAGFALVWQEDPDGLRPGDGSGPGHGWSGATVNHKTDVWYSQIAWSDFARVDENFLPSGDSDHDVGIGRRKALVPMSLPVRITDNASVNTDNLAVLLDEDGFPVEDADGHWIELLDDEGQPIGTHRYGHRIEGLCESFYEFVNNDGAEKKVCVTADGVLLDGDTGASRPNLFLQPYTRPDGSKSAWAIMAYEETKGVGGGAPDHTLGEGPYRWESADDDGEEPDLGKNVHYHSFDLLQPNVAHTGTILNHPSRNVDGALEYLRNEDGTLLLDWQGRPQFAYENARRPRFVLQGKSAIGDSRTVLVALYRQGEDGKGRPADVFLRRAIAPQTGNPYRPEAFVCDEWSADLDLPSVCVRGALNVSSTTPTDIWVNPDADPDSTGLNQKVWKWTQSTSNLRDASASNPWEDARAHRGQLRGDWLIIGYTHTPNWGADRNGNDKHDFYVRRSFDGGTTWTTDPQASEPVERCQTFTNPETQLKEEVCLEVAPGEFEGAVNLSRLRNAQTTVLEPRIVATPGTIKLDGAWTGIDEDRQDKRCAHLSYGTATNPKKDPVTGLQDDKRPLDLFYSVTVDRGQNYAEEEWVVNPDSDGNNAGEIVKRWFRLAHGTPEQGEAQIRSTPDGSRFYATWLEELVDEPGSDIVFRRIQRQRGGD